jgi:hypothetical protein
VIQNRPAALAAVKLAAAGKAAEAVEVAKMINDAPTRDRTLSKLTK